MLPAFQPNPFAKVHLKQQNIGPHDLFVHAHLAFTDLVRVWIVIHK